MLVHVYPIMTKNILITDPDDGSGIRNLVLRIQTMDPDYESGLRIWITNLDYKSGLQIWITNLDYESGLRIWIMNLDYESGL